MPLIDYDDPVNYCPYCDEFLDEYGECPNECSLFDDLDYYHINDLEDVIPGRDYLEGDCDEA